MAKSEYGALRYDPDLYSAATSGLVFTEREARAEYRRLAKLANARLDVLERRGMGDASVLQKFPKEFRSAAGRSEADVRKKLQEVAHFMNLKTTSYKGARSAQKAQLEALQEQGYDFLNMKNISAFGRFMEAAKRHAASKKSFDSERAIEDFQEALESGEIDVDMTQEAFDEYMERGESEEIEEPEEAGAEIVRERPKKSGSQKTAGQREATRKKAQAERAQRAKRFERERTQRQRQSKKRRK